VGAEFPERVNFVPPVVVMAAVGVVEEMVALTCPAPSAAITFQVRVTVDPATKSFGTLAADVGGDPPPQELVVDGLVFHGIGLTNTE